MTFISEKIIKFAVVLSNLCLRHFNYLNHMNLEDFKDIAPYSDSEFDKNMQLMVKDPGFEHAIRYIMPGVDFEAFVNNLLSINNTTDFQIKVMGPFLEMLAQRTTAGLSIDGLENISPTCCHTFISNHRDIVLDAAFLNACLIRSKIPTAEVALGDNLLIYEWIERLVKINKGFIVKRNLKLLEGFKAAKQLSAYIRFCLTQKHESVWIAQREGRAKDSDDRTQESVLKMLALSSPDSVIDALIALNICPVTISYELDPNDYLKAAEFLNRRRDPNFKKSERDDLHSMEIGLVGQKGHVHFHLSSCINDSLEAIRHITDKNELFSRIGNILDTAIHSGYKLYPSNYISYDRVNSTNRFADCYTAQQEAEFDAYLNSQLDKVKVPDVTAEEREYMRSLILRMYANPLCNNVIATEK